jgi:hypothetical protein
MNTSEQRWARGKIVGTSSVRDPHRPYFEWVADRVTATLDRMMQPRPGEPGFVHPLPAITWAPQRQNVWPYSDDKPAPKWGGTIGVPKRPQDTDDSV